MCCSPQWNSTSTETKCIFSAINDFNNGVVLTSRPLRAGEMFEVRLDKMVNKWAGSIEIGVTLHSPQNLDYPSTMTNIRSGTWMMTGNGVMHNGTTVIDEYGHNLDRLKVSGSAAWVGCIYFAQTFQWYPPFLQFLAKV